MAATRARGRLRRRTRPGARSASAAASRGSTTRMSPPSSRRGKRVVPAPLSTLAPPVVARVRESGRRGGARSLGRPAQRGASNLPEGCRSFRDGVTCQITGLPGCPHSAKARALPLASASAHGPAVAARRPGARPASRSPRVCCGPTRLPHALQPPAWPRRVLALKEHGHTASLRGSPRRLGSHTRASSSSALSVCGDAALDRLSFRAGVTAEGKPIPQASHHSSLHGEPPWGRAGATRRCREQAASRAPPIGGRREPVGVGTSTKFPAHLTPPPADRGWRSEAADRDPFDTPMSQTGWRVRIRTSRSMPHDDRFDLVVIGAGSARTRASRVAAGSGRRVPPWSEEGRPGGTCVNVAASRRTVLLRGALRPDFADAARSVGTWARRVRFARLRTMGAPRSRVSTRLRQAARRWGVTRIAGSARGSWTRTKPSRSVSGSFAASTSSSRRGVAALPGTPGIEHALTSTTCSRSLRCGARGGGGRGYIAVEFAGILHGMAQR